MSNSDSVTLPAWIIRVSGWSSFLATSVVLCSIFLHLLNYRKPFQQRLMIRIHLIIPIFALSCYLMLIYPTSWFTKYLIEPIREIYEAFVIYTFFSLLIDMLGGARNIIISNSGRPPTPHPGIVLYFLPPLDISDPYTFLGIKRGILQYVWLKPVICFGTLFAEGLGWYNVNDMGMRSLYLWFTILYNFSVSLSLYCLAIFWKILWVDLKPFNPIGKFLCVKLIIFASYWQGVLLAILNVCGVLPKNNSLAENGAPNIGVSIQNALLCVELVAFAIGHWLSFSYKPFHISNMPSGRLQLVYAFKDMIGFKDLLIDFALTFHGDYYKDYKQFNSVDANISHPMSKGRMSRINQGLRYSTDGRQKHWINQQHVAQVHPNNPLLQRDTIKSTLESFAISPFAARSSLHPQYSHSIDLTSTSLRGIYPGSSQAESSPPSSPGQSEALTESTTFIYESIEEQVKMAVPEIDYSDEDFDGDERFYQQACSVVNNYKLDQIEVKQLINYPIVDEMIDGHEYGYKVKKLRADRLRLSLDRPGSTYSYGTV